MLTGLIKEFLDDNSEELTPLGKSLEDHVITSLIRGASNEAAYNTEEFLESLPSDEIRVEFIDIIHSVFLQLLQINKIKIISEKEEWTPSEGGEGCYEECDKPTKKETIDAGNVGVAGNAIEILDVAKMVNNGILYRHNLLFEIVEDKAT